MTRMTRRELLRVALGAGIAAAVVPMTACADGPPRPPGRLTLATGPAGAVYRELGAALAREWNAAWGSQVVRTVETDAAVENARLVLAGEAELGLVNVDVARAEAVELTAVARVFDSVLHVVVRADGPVRSLPDLAGRRVGLGAAGSGTRFTAWRLQAIAGIDVRRVDLTQQAGAEALLAGEIDALVSLTAMPTPALVWLSERASIEFLPVPEQADRLIAAHPLEYAPATITRAVYPGAEPAATFAVPTVLACRADLDDRIAGFLARVMLERAGALADVRPEARQLHARTAVATSPMPLHPGAAAWFASVKP